MKERVAALVGPAVPGDVGDDLPLGLRADPPPARRPARLQARLHDLRRGRLAADGQALHGRARDRPEALPAALDQGADLGSEEPPARRRDAARGAGLVLRGDGRRRLRHVREADARRERDGLRRPARPHGQPLRAVRRPARALRRATSATSSSTSTRTPTGSSTGCSSCSAASTATSSSSATTRSRSTASAPPRSATSSTSSATSRRRRRSSSSRTTARPGRSSTPPTA